jgi:hypothetical protein
MPSPKFIVELSQELKDQFASNADLRIESELFYDYESRVHTTARDLDAHLITTNDASVCGYLEPSLDRSPLAGAVCRKIGMI